MEELKGELTVTRLEKINQGPKFVREMLHSETEGRNRFLQRLESKGESTALDNGIIMRRTLRPPIGDGLRTILCRVAWRSFPNFEALLGMRGIERR